MRLVKPYVTANTLKMIYYSYFHSIITYGLKFKGVLKNTYVKIPFIPWMNILNAKVKFLHMI